MRSAYQAPATRSARPRREGTVAWHAIGAIQGIVVIS
jgi:hypothetical protein